MRAAQAAGLNCGQMPLLTSQKVKASIAGRKKGLGKKGLGKKGLGKRGLGKRGLGLCDCAKLVARRAQYRVRFGLFRKPAFDALRKGAWWL